MKQRILNASIWSAFALLLGFLFAFGWCQRLQQGTVDVAVNNRSRLAQVVRLTDGSSGRGLGTYRIAAGATLRLDGYRLDTWYREPTPSERAADTSASVSVELLADAGCRLLDRTGLTHGSDALDIGADGSLYVSDGVASGSSDVESIEDPCHGGAPIPQGIIANRTIDTVILGSRVVLAPCSTRTIQRGELAGVPLVTEERGTRVDVPSMDVQGGRWPLEPRSVLVMTQEIVDTRFGPFLPEEWPACEGHPAHGPANPG